MKRIVPESGPAPSRPSSWPAQPEPGPDDAAAAAAPGARRPASARWRRGLLVTPWFAAGAGFVIAAALSLNAPRTFLTYRPNDAPNASRCAGCGSPESAPTSRPGVQIRSADPAVISGAGAARGPAVPIALGPERNGVFTVTFTLPASQATRNWKLRFMLPGRSITQILGARLQADAADDGGVAIRLGLGGGYVSPANPAAQAFQVSVSGSPLTPVGCVLNGQACHFR
ncbi:MAG TPA: hypothetical protein VGH88_17730 [Streptosporangiaceae bacterium]